MNVQPVQSTVITQPVSSFPSRFSQTLYYLFSLTFTGGLKITKSIFSYAWSNSETYEQKRGSIRKVFQEQLASGNQVAIGGKNTSYLFRPRTQSTKKLEMNQFNQVISINPETKIAHMEGMIPFLTVVEETLKFGLLPKVVPELCGITVGGAISGLAVESSSFKYGLFHRSVKEMEVLTGDGKIHIATRDNENSDLFYAIPNSYGTLGYILSAKIELVKVKPYVHLNYLKFDNLQKYFEAVKEYCLKKEKFDFVDGAIFSKDLMVLVTGEFIDEAPQTSNYRPNEIYYKAIQQKNEDYLTTSDYIWRWDTDSFWNTEQPGFLQNPTFRKWVGPYLLRSDRLLQVERFRQEFSKNVIKPYTPISEKPKREKLTQDVGIPVDRCAEFIEWFQEEIGIFPIFVCPIESPNKSETYPLWDLSRGGLSCDIGFFNSKKTEFDPAEGHYNKLVESAVEKHGGKKSLYSRSYFEEEHFKELYYGGDAYEKLKAKYDPQEKFPTLYEKCVKNK